MITNIADFLPPIRQLQEQIRDSVVAAAESTSPDELAQIAKEEAGDTIYVVDKISEEVLLDFFTHEIASHTPIILIAEGLGETGQMVLPAGVPEKEARWRIIVDPIDGTRGIMYQKRSAWILTGVAPNKGQATNLSDIELAVQTEVPLIKQHLSDTLWSIAGQGVRAERYNRLTGDTQPLVIQPSRATTIAHGYAMISRFFPGAREELAAIDEEIVRDALGPVQPGKAHCFEDQYICTGGQFYELITGRDRFNADIRPLLETLLAQRGLALGICCHPYDLCTELIAREAGVIITDASGQPLLAPLDVSSNISWVGYANAAIQAQIEPLLQQALRRRGLLSEEPPRFTDNDICHFQK
ncbi:MAG: inositol monophosphatase [Anaerolineales bacterium]|nr:inositol monophosphatase [Anaerolineales bacterium]